MQDIVDTLMCGKCGEPIEFVEGVDCGAWERTYEIYECKDCGSRWRMYLLKDDAVNNEVFDTVNRVCRRNDF